MQPYSDMFLGWTENVRTGRQFFIRRLRDIKISVRVATFGATEMTFYAQWLRPRAGPRALLDPALISGYLGLLLTHL